MYIYILLTNNFAFLSEDNSDNENHSGDGDAAEMGGGFEGSFDNDDRPESADSDADNINPVDDDESGSQQPASNDDHGSTAAYILTDSGSSSWLAKAFNDENENEVQLPRDHAQPSDKSNPNSTLDKRTLAIDLHDWQSRHNISRAAMDDMLSLLGNHFVHANLPVVAKNPILTAKTTESKTITNNIHKYVGKDTRTVVIDVCTKDCIAFHGCQLVRGIMTDCSTMMYCPYCNETRYSACSHPDCKDRDYAACSPHSRDPTTGKPTGHQSRIPRKTAYVRSIIAKFLSLYKQSLCAGNEDLLKYLEKSPHGKASKYRVTREGCFIDSCDGEVVDSEYESMKTKFREVNKQYQKENPGKRLYMCALLFTLFYDGMVLFERDCNSIWPMILSILNCNPSLRTRLGVGLFAPLIHDMKPETKAETYIIRSFLAAELKQLEDGIIFTFEHPEHAEPVTVYLQGRCVLFHLDGDALEHFCRLHGAMSSIGCKCRTMKGSHRKSLPGMVYLGSRARLGMRHFLRDFVVPNGHFHTLAEEEDYYNEGHEAQPIIHKLFEATKLKDAPDATDEMYTLGNYILIGDDVIKSHASEYKKQHKSTEYWYNHEFPLTMYQPHLCYPARDRRVQLLYADSHLSHELYLESGKVVEQALLDYELKYWGKEKPKTKYRPFLNGVTGLNPILADTMTMKVTSLTYDMMHIGKNVSQYYNAIVTGVRAYTENSRRLSAALKVFGFLQYNDKKYIPPWQVTNDDMVDIDSICNCFLMPSGNKTKFGLRWPCRRNSQLRAREHLIFLTAFNYYLYSFTSMKQGYVDYFARYASDLCRLLNPCLHVDELDELILSVNETQSLFEGLFPESEQHFVHHEIVDVVNHIRNFGSVRGLMCFTGERTLSTISSFVARGGVHPLKGIDAKYFARENINSKNLKTPFEFLRNDGMYSDFVLKLVGKTENIQLTDHELDALLTCVKNVVETSCMETFLEKSSFMRIAYAHKRSCETYAMGSEFTLAHWIRFIYSQYLHVGAMAQLDVYLRGYIVGINRRNINEITPAEAAQNAQDGIILLSDFEGIVKEIATFVPVAYKQGYIKGIKFKCRGAAFREGQPALPATYYNTRTNSRCNKYIPTNPLNNVADNWYKDYDYSAYARVNTYSVKWDKETGDPRVQPARTEFCQLNILYRLNWKSDSFLYGLGFADGCFHTSTYEKSKRKYYIEPEKSFNPEIQYVCLNYVCGSPIGLSVLDAENRPMIRQDRFSSVSWSNEKDHLRIAPMSAKVERIYFLELNPERVDYLYGLIEDDLDKTKLFEKV